MKRESDWIIYLQLSSNLPKHFIDFDNEFKSHGMTLIPADLKSIWDLLAVNKEVTIICVVKDLKSRNSYLRYVRDKLKRYIRSGKVSFHVASTFSQVNDSSFLSREKRFFYYQIPLKSKEFCSKVISSMNNQSIIEQKWPGGSSPKPGYMKI